MPVPSQSPQLVQPSLAYVRLGFAGMSGGFLPDLQYFRHSPKDFRSRVRANARELSNGLQFARPTLCQSLVEIASAKSLTLIFIPTGTSPSMSTILPLDIRPFSIARN